MATVNAGFGSLSPVASGGDAHKFDTTTTYSAGNIVTFKNNTTEKASVDFEGTFTGHDGIFGGKATVAETLVVVGNITGAAGAFTTGAFSGILSVTNTTQATSTTTASAKTAGGWAVVKNAFIGGDLAVAGTGPHALGGATVNWRRLNLTGAFTSGGASTAMAGLYMAGALTGAVGDTLYLTGAIFANTIVTQGTDTSVAIVSQVRIEEPGITNNLASSGTPAAAVSLYVKNAPTEGTDNYAFWVDSGTTRLDGDLDHNGSNVGFYGTTPVAKQTGVAVSAAGVHAALVSLGLISA